MGSPPTPAEVEAEDADSQQPARERLPRMDSRTWNSLRILREPPGTVNLRTHADDELAYWERLYQQPDAAPGGAEPSAEPRFLGATLREFEPPPPHAALVLRRRQQPRSAQPVTRSSRKRGLRLLLTAALLVATAGVSRLPVSASRTAHGVLLGHSPAHALPAPITGVVREIAVAPGQRVQPGQPLLQLDAPELRAELLQLSDVLQQLALRRQQQDARDVLQASQLRALRTQRDVLQRRFDDALQRLSQLRAQRRTYERMLEAGVTYTGSLEDLTLQVQQRSREALALEQDLANNKLQQLDLEQTKHEQQDALQTELAEALARRRALEQQLALSRVTATDAGRVEQLLVKVGERVEPGQPLAQQLSLEPLSRALLELPASERTKLRVGGTARVLVEEPGLPELYLPGRITAITQPASGGLQVEVQLRLSGKLRAQLEPLSPGTQITATLRATPQPLLDVALEEGRAFAQTL